MKNKNTFFAYTRIAFVLLGLSAYSLHGFGQNNATQPQPQPLKKTNAVAASGVSGTKDEPWQKQPIVPDKTKPAGTTTQSARAKPEQAHPIQH
jgi:hypothetical protein